MADSRLDLLRRQFDLTWALGEVHLAELTPDDFLWEPAPVCWTMRCAGGGEWVADWVDTEPDPILVPTMAWLSWHIGWWWSTTGDHVLGRPIRTREDVRWPGPDDAVAWLNGLRDEWLTVLDGLTDAWLDEPSAYPWPGDAGLTVGDQIAWVNAELMKNIAEIGQLRLIRAARVSVA
ncbi:DinB family protein [Tsukamurella pseudospumae]|uniref:Damage-inducible protein DinB n=1 Tax=Tsukamurella pseudospumae TaxID=239498 RepID=A0A138AQ61_9ACTN|nr:DinB family protein [Tsukamurella pseudospumae]KXP12578.1 damage-inducible protein DinB [Tsukamurella pseudospumae]